MGNFPNDYQRGLVRATYRPGTRIELISMADPWSRLKQGDRGTVTNVDDACTIHMAWDNGSSLGLIPGEDQFKVVKEG